MKTIDQFNFWVNKMDFEKESNVKGRDESMSVHKDDHLINLNVVPSVPVFQNDYMVVFETDPNLHFTQEEIDRMETRFG